MTTTISKHEVQQQQQQQQQQQTATTTAKDCPNATQLQFDTLNNNELAVRNDSDPGQVPAKGLKRRSLLNFKSFDFHIKSLYSGLRTGAAGHKSESASRSSSLGDGDGVLNAGLPTAGVPILPHLRIEDVDTEQAEESMDLLLDYTQSPSTPRRDSGSLLLPPSSLSPYYLSPYMAVSGGTAAAAATANDDSGSGNIRRSSTSDIVACRRRGSTSSSSSRRPSTSDLLRRARERRGSEARMGRSVSHSAMRSGGGAGCMGGRRTSMAF